MTWRYFWKFEKLVSNCKMSKEKFSKPKPKAKGSVTSPDSAQTNLLQNLTKKSKDNIITSKKKKNRDKINILEKLYHFLSIIFGYFLSSKLLKR